MKKWILLAIVLLMAVLALAPAVFAQGPLNQDNSAYGPGSMRRGGFGAAGWSQQGYAPGPMFGMGSRWGGPAGSLITVAAEQLSMTPAELLAELQAGQTIAQVAEGKGVAVETIVEAFVALRAERLAELVANGQLTQEQADAMLAAMRANVTARLSEPWNAGGPGRGRGPGYTDQDGDGVCDNFVDENGDGVCDLAGTGRGGRGAGYTDADGDGVCDHMGAGRQAGGRGGRMMGRWSW